MMNGTMHNDGAAQLDYRLIGADATYRCNDKLRFYFEYAIRSEDVMNPAGRQNHIHGTVYEAEVLLSERKRISLLARYDTLEHRGASIPDSTTRRFTWGVNMVLPGESLLMFNHEHWIIEPGIAQEPEDIDVLGFRWVGTF